MAGNGSEEELTLAGTPTWIVAVVCTTIILISLVFERFLHHVGKVLIRKNQKPLFEALQTMKGELMLMGVISLLLVVSQGAIQKICIPVSYSRHLRPCRGQDLTAEGDVSGDYAAHRGRLLLSAGGSEHCQRQGKIPLLSIEAIHDLHIFIFALASTHVFLSVKTIALAGAKIHKWKFCEVSIHEETPEDASVSSRIASAHGIKSSCYQHRRGFGKCSVVVTWAHYFLKQFFSTLTTSEYRAMRLGFIMAHCNGNLRFDFYSYLLRALEEDYKKVVGLSWYLWIYVILFLLMNIGGWHEYFWLSFVPLILLLTVGTKLQHIKTELISAATENHSTIEGQTVIKPSDQYFWFHRPQILLFCIHLILFIVAFQFAYFFCILIAYGYSSCVMDRTAYVVPRLIISFGVRVFASYSILPLYAVLTQMGSNFKSVIFEERIKVGLIQWARKARMRTKRLKSSTSKGGAEEVQIQIGSTRNGSLVEESGAEITEEREPESVPPSIEHE